MCSLWSATENEIKERATTGIRADRRGTERLRNREDHRHPRRTICDWRHGRHQIRPRSTPHSQCTQLHRFSILPGERARVAKRPDSECVDVSMWSKHWPCLIPQHGPGRKHLRAITLEQWQDNIVAPCRRSFLRGLIHSDGARVVATDARAPASGKPPLCLQQPVGGHKATLL